MSNDYSILIDLGNDTISQSGLIIFWWFSSHHHKKPDVIAVIICTQSHSVTDHAFRFPLMHHEPEDLVYWLLTRHGVIYPTLLKKYFH